MDATAGGDPFLETLGAKDPAPLLHRLREKDPVHFVPSLGCWVVTRHDDVKRLLTGCGNLVPQDGFSPVEEAAEGGAGRFSSATRRLGLDRGATTPLQ